MSSHVYIARERFKETPIALDAWLVAARQCEDVTVEERKNRRGVVSYHVRPKGDEQAWLGLTPYGLVHAQDPSRHVVATMFKLADALGAGVYSERLTKYESVDDWERRTEKYRLKRDKRRADYRQSRIVRIVLWVTFLALTGVVVWVLGEK